MVKTQKFKNKWVVYPDVELTLDDIKKYFMTNTKKKSKKKIDDTKKYIEELEIKPMEDIAENIADVGTHSMFANSAVTMTNNFFDTTNEDELAENEENSKELTDEQKRELFIKRLKESKVKFRPIVHIGKVTINKFGEKFKKERKRKNKQQKKSRKSNRGKH